MSVLKERVVLFQDGNRAFLIVEFQSNFTDMLHKDESVNM
jgi:hypothetical protein